MRDLFHEPDTSRAQNTALIVERDPWTELNTFWFFDLFVQESGACGAKLDAVFLELTFAGLVANRAIQRMID
jgi:hypothetical protein